MTRRAGSLGAQQVGVSGAASGRAGAAQSAGRANIVFKFAQAPATWGGRGPAGRRQRAKAARTLAGRLRKQRASQGAGPPLGFAVRRRATSATKAAARVWRPRARLPPRHRECVRPRAKAQVGPTPAASGGPARTHTPAARLLWASSHQPKQRAPDIRRPSANTDDDAPRATPARQTYWTPAQQLAAPTWAPTNRTSRPAPRSPGARVPASRSEGASCTRSGRASAACWRPAR